MLNTLRYRYNGKIKVVRVRHLSAHISLPKGRTGNGSLHRHPYILCTLLLYSSGPLFPTLQIVWDWRARPPAPHPQLRHWSE